MNENVLKEIVENLVEAADELLQKERKNLVEQGQLLAYAESLSIIRDAMAGHDLVQIGLDFDIDSKYLT